MLSSEYFFTFIFSGGKTKINSCSQYSFSFKLQNSSFKLLAFETESVNVEKFMN